VAVVWILMTVVGGLLFYGLRCRYQFVYGLIELGAALTIIFLTFVPQTNFLLLRRSTCGGRKFGLPQYVKSA
jgi:hypothetical protein